MEIILGIYSIDFVLFNQKQLHSGSYSVSVSSMDDEVFLFLDAARYGDLEDLKSMPSSLSRSFDSFSGNSALHYAAANGHLEVVDYLLSIDADANARNSSGNTPLHWASINGRIEVVQKLLDHGADANVRNEFNERPFEEALKRKIPEICELLAKVTNFNEDPEFKNIENTEEQDIDMDETDVVTRDS
jgi:ankyrin repeat protein